MANNGVYPYSETLDNYSLQWEKAASNVSFAFRFVKVYDPYDASSPSSNSPRARIYWLNEDDHNSSASDIFGFSHLLRYAELPKCHAVRRFSTRKGENQRHSATYAFRWRLRRPSNTVLRWIASDCMIMMYLGIYYRNHHTLPRNIWWRRIPPSWACDVRNTRYRKTWAISAPRRNQLAVVRSYDQSFKTLWLCDWCFDEVASPSVACLSKPHSPSLSFLQA